jgi:hypothetical protein
MRLQNNVKHTTQGIITLIRIFLSQDYFTFRNKIFQQAIGDSLGSFISSTIAEILLQFLEDMHIKNPCHKKYTNLNKLFRRHHNYTECFRTYV